MSAVIGAARTMNVTDMPGMPLVIGSMMSPNPDRTRMAGVILHYVVIGTVVFGLVYGWLFRLLGSAGWVTGEVTGLVHGVVVGLVMPMPSIHPRVSREPAAVGAPAVQIEDGEVEVSNLGVFGVDWGRMTPVGLVVAHVVYGIVLALVYTALV